MGLVTNVLTTQKTINADITAFPVDRDDDAEVLLEAVGTESRRPIDSWSNEEAGAVSEAISNFSLSDRAISLLESGMKGSAKRAKAGIRAVVNVNHR